MPRRPRRPVGGIVYHVLNRGNCRATLFHKDGDYAAFESALHQALARFPVDLFAWIAMPNHWHLVLRPRTGPDLSDFVRWLTVTHTQRSRAHSHTTGQGHLYQGRYKSFPVQPDDHHFLRLCRYVERNALRANLVDRAESWPWSSLHTRTHGPRTTTNILSPWPVDPPRNYLTLVNRPMTPAEESAIQTSITRNRPYGDDHWLATTTKRLGLTHTLRNPGRPRKPRPPR